MKKRQLLISHRGLFEFKVMPFGLSNEPAVFQELLILVLQGCDHFATAYLDDIMLSSATLEEHM